MKGGALKGIKEKAYCIGDGEHPDPLGLVFVPDEQLIDSFFDEDIDGVYE